VDGLCSRCLVILDSRTVVRASDGQDSVVCPFTGSPSELARWVERMGSNGMDRFIIDAMPDAFIPVASWNGDPICDIHLIEVRTAEMRERR
jgi:hypothetical protein